MASTNKTTNYQLSQFQSSDIPAWLTDYNGDMQKIDAGIHAAKTQADGAANGVSALQTAVSGKQDTLTFDTAPISGSSNPVTSGGIYNALQNVSVQTDAVPTAGSTKAVQSGGVFTALQGKQNTLTFDSTPVQGSTNPVTSGGVFAALQNANVEEIPVYRTSALTTISSDYRIFKLGDKIFLYSTPKLVAKTSWQSFSDSTSWKYTILSPVLAGNPFNLTTISLPTRAYYMQSYQAPKDFLMFGDTADSDGLYPVKKAGGSATEIGFYYDGTCTRMYYVMFATDTVFGNITTNQVGSSTFDFTEISRYGG